MDELLLFGNSVFEDGILIFSIRSVIILLLCQFFVTMVRKAVKHQTELRGEQAKTPIRFLGNGLIILIRIVAVFMILGDIKPLSTLGRTLLGATSLITIVVGLAAQEAFGNLIAGSFLAMYQPFRIGDLITIASQNVTGTVEEITLRHTVIKTYDGSRVIIPNATMNSAVVENKRTENFLFSRQIVLSVAYDTDIDLARKTIIDCVTKTKGYIDPRTEEQKADNAPPVSVVVTDFLDSGIELRFRVYTKTSAEAYSFAGEVREGILKAFREKGIEIPYPTRTVELRP